jgi:hypothetical protein
MSPCLLTRHHPRPGRIRKLRRVTICFVFPALDLSQRVIAPAGDGLRHYTASSPRVDVRAAEDQLHAVSAAIGVATASILPNIMIGANAGHVGTALPGLISAPNLFWQLAGDATQTVFDGGILLHQLQGAKDTYQRRRGDIGIRPTIRRAMGGAPRRFPPP